MKEDKTPQEYIDSFFGREGATSSGITEFRPGREKVVSKVGLLFLKPITERDLLKIIGHTTIYYSKDKTPFLVWLDNNGGEDTCDCGRERIYWYKICITCGVEVEAQNKMMMAYRSAFRSFDIDGEVYYEDESGFKKLYPEAEDE
jgi:hypothetical protein